MSDPTREEIDAKLAAAEARTETRFTELNGKMDRLADSIAVLGSTIKIELESHLQNCSGALNYRL